MSHQDDLRENERTIGQLVADATHDISGIVRSEIALAKAEVSSGAKVMGKGAGFLVCAAVLGVLGKKALDAAKPTPEKAIEQAQLTVAAVKDAARS